MIRRGFTVVELIITITIMGILLTLAVVGLNATQINGRDAERRGDVEIIATHLETYYRNDDADFGINGGTYLESGYMNGDGVKFYLRDLDLKNIRAPGVALTDPSSFVPATNNVATTAGVQPQPSKSNDVYVYQPLNAAGALCTDPILSGDCRKFSIFYYQESDNTVKVLTSKNQ